MGVPADILAVERPTGTAVFDRGGNGPHHWAVRMRSGVVYKKGKNPQPRYGETIGYIIDHKFIPKVEKNAVATVAGQKQLQPDSVQYGAAAFVHTVVEDIQDDLLKVYPVDDAFKILTIACLRVVVPGVPDSRLRYNYEKSLISKQYPAIPLSTATVHKLFKEVGARMDNRAKFSLLRLQRIAADHHIAIDGMLKQDNGTVNDLGNYSGKSRVKGRMELSILYAYDVELGEPICSEVFPGNTVDESAYLPFIEHNHITNGILVDDKGFPPDKLEEILKDYTDLHFLTPIKRNNKRIAQNHMLEFTGVLNYSDRVVYYNKKQIPGGHYLYAFRDPKRAMGEDVKYAVHAVHMGVFNEVEYTRKSKTYGVIVFESDLDLPPETVYACYEDRWQVEMVFNEYKSLLDLDETREQGDFVVIGSEFVNFIATLITTRLLRKIEDSGLFNGFTYTDVLDDLRSSWREVDAPEPMTADDYWVHVNEEDYWVLEHLGLSKPNPAHPVNHPRNKKGNCTVSNDTKKASPKEHADSKTIQKEVQAEKRPVGRPRIHPPKDPDAPKRPVGRPRIHPPKDPDAPKRPVGRPRIHPLKDPDASKRPRGQSKTNPLPTEVQA